jgi:hypothetical protein
MFRFTLWSQTVYYLITAIWPLVHIESFMAVTGPKTDIWLVKTVGALLIPISLCFLTHLFMRVNHWPVVILATVSCISFASIDLYYALNNVIDDIYLADAAAQILLLILWIIIILRHQHYEGLKTNRDKS